MDGLSPGARAIDPLRLLLRYRSFGCLAAGRTLANLANSMAPVALAFTVLDLTGSTGDLGLVVGARSLANVLLLLFGGVLADRIRRALLLQGTAVASAVVQAVLALSVLLGFASVSLLLVLSVINGALSAVSLPAAGALTPQTVPAADLQQANAVARMGMNAGVVAGTSLAGVLVALAGPGWALAADAGVFLLEAACYTGVRVGGAVLAAAVRSHPLRDLREGWSEFASRSWLWAVVLQFMVVNAAESGSIQVLGPGIADTTVGRTAWGFVLAAQMAGALAGGVIAIRVRLRHALLVGVVAVGLVALPLLAMAESPRTAVLVAAMFLSGVAVEQFGVAWDVSLQQNIPADRLARVYSYDALGSFVAIPLGQVAVGPLADRIGVRTTLLAASALIVAATAAALLSRGIRQLTIIGPSAAGPTAPVPVPARPQADAAPDGAAAS